MTLFFTTMANHRPVYTVGGSSNPEAPRQFHATAARDPSVPSVPRDPRDPSDPNPNTPALRDFLARSTQPIFSVSAMFRMRAGGGCGSCGH